MQKVEPHRRPQRPTHAGFGADVAALYNGAGDRYLAYADGDRDRLFDFAGLHAYSDRQLFSLLQKKLSDLRRQGASGVRLLDAGCGPGTWLRRCVAYARRVGFTRITARGFDVAGAQIETARALAQGLARVPGVELSFDVADLTDGLPEPDGSIDITLCLYSVLSHLPVSLLPKVSAEIARITSGCFVATVRSIGSSPTAFVDSIEEARYLKLDHARGRCEVEFRNGYRTRVNFHLFTAEELSGLFHPHFTVEALRGLDIFHSRFLPDRRWNPASLADDGRVLRRLAQLEESCAADPAFVERGMHLLLVGKRRLPDPKREFIRRRQRSPIPVDLPQGGIAAKSLKPVA